LRQELSRLAAELGVADRVALAGPLPRREIPAVLAAVDVLVNATRAGAPDKVVYEAAASCRPALASSPVFADLLDDLPLDLAFGEGDHEALAARLAALATAPRELRAAIGSRLRERVERNHSVERWADRLLELCRA
jgi:glycosyltransferase involved in cell wall biosynthesis